MKTLMPGVQALVALAALALSTLATAQDRPEWSLAIHGGAGVITREQMAGRDPAYRAALNRALEAGAAVLSRGGSSLDAVQAAVEVMEDEPLFNAGRGAVFTAAGRNELDAAIMNGPDMAAGAVAGLTRTRHPIAAARAVMETSPHVMMIGEGAETFAGSQGLEQVPHAFFFTESRWTALEHTLRERGEPVPVRPEGAPAPSGQMAALDEAPLDERKYGTVGAVAVDREGRLAAATSTGGMTGKKWGRVGDVPVIGAGTYASNGQGCAVSATGSGEMFIRATVARDICWRMAHHRPTVQAAAEAELAEVKAMGGDGGVIVMDRAGRPTFAMNSPGMYRGAISAREPARTAIYADETPR